MENIKFLERKPLTSDLNNYRPFEDAVILPTIRDIYIRFYLAVLQNDIPESKLNTYGLINFSISKKNQELLKEVYELDGYKFKLKQDSRGYFKLKILIDNKYMMLTDLKHKYPSFRGYFNKE